MDRQFLASAAVTVLSLAGYVIGTVEPYPGREASLMGLLVGVTLATVTYGHARATAESDAGRERGDRDRDGKSNSGGGVR
ncbi:hypothetical protein [Halobaculum gomorrense]|uniref:Uncharacterized protein n=1 Tax=Halobaculum gomorrense TaxID=43928 RepID=A0A1M5Q6L2_9EURY|nr:hypothetical protein [Halobaculum gomorrense]SHH09536.1 hypothetical protein SAMN05443636_1761 [Halobaculum gomorrense]